MANSQSSVLPVAQHLALLKNVLPMSPAVISSIQTDNQSSFF